MAERLAYKVCRPFKWGGKQLETGDPFTEAATTEQLQMLREYGSIRPVTLRTKGPLHANEPRVIMPTNS